jgi:sugar phosphate isomerase/epimerase
LQNRPCGDGVVDFAAIIAVLAAANPAINLTIENAEPHAERTIGRTQTCVEVFDSRFLEGHPDLTVEEFAAYLKLVRDYEQSFAARGLLDWAAYEARPFGYDDSLAEIQRSAAHLRPLLFVSPRERRPAA